MKTLQRTFAIIKPDAVAKNATGDIISTINANGFRIIGMRQLHITKSQAEGFYAVHANRPFFDSLTTFMSSGPIVVLAMEKEGDAIAAWRKLMGATNPANAEEGPSARSGHRASSTTLFTVPMPKTPPVSS